VETRLRRAGRERLVTLTANADGFAATLDGAAHRLASLVAGPPTLAAGGATVEELALEIDGRLVRALVARRPGRVLVALDGTTWTFETGDDARRGEVGGAGSGTVTAPMPGKVVAVLVKPGDEVQAGQALVVLEAMKMETTLAAEVSGIVREVHATPGGMVGAGTVVVVVAPSAA
jgi:3-methylcrotonyl-CoA carboxylase alpha subunit